MLTRITHFYSVDKQSAKMSHHRITRARQRSPVAPSESRLLELVSDLSDVIRLLNRNRTRDSMSSESVKELDIRMADLISGLFEVADYAGVPFGSLAGRIKLLSDS